MIKIPTTKVKGIDRTLDCFSDLLSKPQQRHFRNYVVGLVVAEKGNKNIQNIVSLVNSGPDQSSLNRFLCNDTWNRDSVNRRRIDICVSKRKGGLLILDDTLLEKTGKHMEGVGSLYDHSQRKHILCHSMVSTYYVNADENNPLFMDLYVKKEIAETIDCPFKTKIDLAKELLTKSLDVVEPEAIVVDSWFYSKEIIDFCREKKIPMVSRAKSSRTVLSEMNGSNWERLLRTSQGIGSVG